jgi:hypothetical protein
LTPEAAAGPDVPPTPEAATGRDLAPRPQPGGARRVLWSTAAILLVVSGVFGIGLIQALNAGPRSTPAPASSYPPSPVEGVVVAVDSAGLGRVSGFTIRVPGGATLSFELGTLENPTEFSPSHITEHMATSEAVRVYFRVEDTRPIVYRLEDAAASGASPAT